MIVITGFLNCSSDHLKNLIFDSIEVNIIKVGPMAFSVFLVGYDTYGIKYHFHIYPTDFWKFQKLISKKFLYNLLDKKTPDNLFRKDHIIILEGESILLEQDYTVLRKQTIEV